MRPQISKERSLVKFISVITVNERLVPQIQFDLFPSGMTSSCKAEGLATLIVNLYET